MSGFILKVQQGQGISRPASSEGGGTPGDPATYVKSINGQIPDQFGNVNIPTGGGQGGGGDPALLDGGEF